MVVECHRGLVEIVNGNATNIDVQEAAVDGLECQLVRDPPCGLRIGGICRIISQSGGLLDAELRRGWG